MAWDDVSSVGSVNHEANIQGGGKPVHVVFKYLSRSMLLKGGGEGGVTPPPLTTTLFPADPWTSFPDDVTVATPPRCFLRGLDML